MVSRPFGREANCQLAHQSFIPLYLPRFVAKSFELISPGFCLPPKNCTCHCLCQDAESDTAVLPGSIILKKGDDSDDEPDTDEEWKKAVKADAKKQKENADAKAQPLPMNLRGEVFKDGQKIGRVACPGFGGSNPSVQVACYKHSGCHVWARLRYVPDTMKLREWIAAQDAFLTADKHLEAFNITVYGKPTGPSGTTKPGG